MTVHPTDPDTFEENTGIIETGSDDDLDEVPVEAPEADAAEQHTDLAPRLDSLQEGDPDNASEADRAEQARIVETDEDDYR
jgi:hypothetical protein